MEVRMLSPDEWSEVSQEAHKICFDELKLAEYDRISFALMAVDEEKPLAYMTLQELDGLTVYLQHGGAFPGTRGSVNSYLAYVAMLKELKKLGYQRAGTYIENTNKPMLKMAMKAGWLITGIRTFEGSVLLEHQLKFSDMEV